MWFEFATSFSLDLWLRPQRLFLGTEIEGGVLTCLVTDSPLSRYSGFGIVVSGSDRKGKVIFRATQGTNQISLIARIIEDTWYHVAAVFSTGDLGCVGLTCTPARMQLYLDAVLVDDFVFKQPGAVTFWPANDLTIHEPWACTRQSQKNPWRIPFTFPARLMRYACGGGRFQHQKYASTNTPQSPWLIRWTLGSKPTFHSTAQCAPPRFVAQAPSSGTPLMMVRLS